MRESIWHEHKFDPNAQFEVNKPFTFGSEDFVPGEIFDKKTSPRMKRILYDGRKIVMVPPAQVAKSPPPPAAVSKETALAEESGSVEEVIDPDTAKRPELVTKAGGWYDVIDSEGVKLNETSLRIGPAKKLIEEASHDVDVRRGPGE